MGDEGLIQSMLSNKNDLKRLQKINRLLQNIFCRLNPHIRNLFFVKSSYGGNDPQRLPVNIAKNRFQL